MDKLLVVCGIRSVVDKLNDVIEVINDLQEQISELGIEDIPEVEEVALKPESKPVIRRQKRKVKKKTGGTKNA